MDKSSSPSRNGEAKDPLYWCRQIEALASGWDADGAIGPKPPYEWETVARMAMDYARAALRYIPLKGPHFSDTLKNHLWRMYQEGNGSADHTDREVFYEMLDSLADSIPAEREGTPRSEIEQKYPRVIKSTDCHCPSCGHNRCASSTSSIDNEDGTFYCQRCSAEWREVP